MSHSYPTRHSYGPGGADRARVLRHLGRVGQPRAVVIALVVDEDLGLVLQPPEGAGMDDAVAVALKAGARRALRLGEVAPPALVGPAGEGGRRIRLEHGRDPTAWPEVAQWRFSACFRRSAERRVGKECVSPCTSRGWPGL